MFNLFFNGTALSGFGVYVDSSESFVKPARRSNTVQVPGRNGDLVMPEVSFENVSVDFPCLIANNFAENFNNLINFLHSTGGEYCQLITEQDESAYRMASFSAYTEPEPGAFYRYGRFVITFNCKPQRYLNSGQQAQTFTKTGTITNPTLFASRPLLRAYGTGTFTIGGVTVQIVRANSYTDIDCEMMDCFKGLTPCNANVVFSGNDFPTIPAGASGVSLGSGITKLEITPRWWKL